MFEPECLKLRIRRRQITRSLMLGSGSGLLKVPQRSEIGAGV